jgi:hypothetical protein
MKTNFRSTILTAAVALALVTSVPAQSRESTDRDAPVRLMSSEITGAIAPYRELYYSFVAAPGELVFTLDVYRGETGYGPQVTIELFDDDANTIHFENGFSSKYVFGVGTENARGVFRAPITQRQHVTMRVSTKDVREGGRFRLRLAGPVMWPRPQAAR